ncbi:MAG TPA: alpha-glucan family phosphorylase [candidate division Zixibacteria bacterium]|nr:alpha-glucan family phosphorylase [candidate division Zixibacteria bacterium]
MTTSLRVPTLPGHDFAIPRDLEGLGELAYNLWWSWTPRAGSVFARMDAQAWARHRNPIPVLRAMDAARWAALLDDEDFVVDASRLIDEFTRYMENGADSWYRAQADGGRSLPGPIAYFCAEYGIHESMQIYSGGLGVLAGDHLKSASDAALPFIGVGLLYRRGYFRQQIDADGHQEHAQPDLDPAQLPLRRARGANGAPLQVSVDFPGRQVHAAVWVAQVGRVPLILLDTDIPANDEADRPITHILYVRGREMRLCQELVLGVGGVRALRGLEIEPAVWHLNEGHSAFLLLERALEVLVQNPGMAPAEALRRVGRNSVFTIHTPVPAGNEVFDRSPVTKYLAAWLEAAGMPAGELLELGRGRTDAPDAGFDMTAFVLRHAADANAVSQLHGGTATETWREVAGHPIRAITNGVHVATWLGRPTRRLYERAIGTSLAVDVASEETFAGLEGLDDEDLWAAHQQQKRELIAFTERRLMSQFARHGESPDALRAISDALDPNALIIGFARRFATYKRADLIFRDEDRLAALLGNPERPVQIVIAGKAHPADRPGQQVIQRIFQLSRSERLQGRVFVLEDYDMRIARFLVSGVDIWLNNPRRPMEASGTSGMKAALNGIPSLSILDGWWDEGFNGENGWAIGSRTHETDDPEQQDAADADALYRLLETEIVPCYFDRDADGLPRRWIGVMRAAVRSSIWQFSTRRMLGEYLNALYLPNVSAAMEPTPA